MHHQMIIDGEYIQDCEPMTEARYHLDALRSLGYDIAITDGQVLITGQNGDDCLIMVDEDFLPR